MIFSTHLQPPWDTLGRSAHDKTPRAPLPRATSSFEGREKENWPNLPELNEQQTIAPGRFFRVFCWGMKHYIISYVGMIIHHCKDPF